MSQGSVPSLQVAAPAKFDGEGYQLWATRMKNYLILHDLWSAVDPTVTPSSPAPSLAKQSQEQQKKKTTEESAPSTSVSTSPSADLGRSLRAFALISAFLSDSLLTSLTYGVSTGRELWHRIETTYAAKSQVNSILLRQQWDALAMSDADDVNTFIVSVKQKRAEMLASGLSISDDDVIYKLLMGLPPSWQPLVTALTIQGVLREDDVIKHLIQHQLMRSREPTASVQVTTATPPSRSRNAQHRNKSGFKKASDQGSAGSSKYCELHGQCAHATSECRDLKKQREQHIQQRSQRRSAPSDHPSSSVNMAGASDSPTVTDASVDLTAAPQGHHNFAAQTGKVNGDAWLVDTGATDHMTPDKSILTDFVDIPPRSVRLGNGEAIQATGQGKIHLLLKSGETATLNGVLYVPLLQQNLFSSPRAADAGWVMVTLRDKITFFKEDKPDHIVMSALRKGDAYYLEANKLTQAYNVSSTPTPLSLWHERLAHVAKDTIVQMTKTDVATGIDLSESPEDLTFCQGCAQGKQHAVPIHVGEPHTHADHPLEIVHSDVVGPITPKSIDGFNYAVTFIDDLTRYAWVTLLKNKAQVADAFKTFLAKAEKQLERQVKVLRSDCGGEYDSADFKAFLASRGIVQQHSAPHTPQQNGIAERLNRTLFDMVRSLLHGRQVAKQFWSFALATAVYLKNRCPHRILNGRSPFEALYGQLPDLSHLRVFGCEAWALTPSGQRTKLDAKSHPCTFIGYCEDSASTTYFLFDPDTRRIIRSRDVLFNEEKNTISVPPQEATQLTVVPITTSVTAPVIQPAGLLPDPPSPPSGPVTPYRGVIPPVPESPVSQADPGDLLDAVVTVPLDSHALVVDADPDTIEEARSRPDAEQWESEIQEELASMRAHHVYDLTTLPPGYKPIKCRFVFRRKFNPDGTVARYKARLVAKGFTQVQGIDYEETFAPVAKFTSIRVLLALAASEQYVVHQMDVKTAFLHGDLNETIYMEQPPGNAVAGQEHLVWHLRKSIYGLKQAPRMWNKKLNEFFLSIGFRRIEADHSIYVYGNRGDHYVAVSVYVDDLLICGQLDDVNQTKAKLSTTFDMKDMGDVHWLLGVEITRTADGYMLSQHRYIQSTLKDLNLADCKTVGTPMEPGTHLSNELAGDSDLLPDPTPYRHAVGSLIYLVTCTRPDIAASVSIVSRFLAKPQIRHWEAVKRIYRYLKASSHHALHISAQGNDDVIAQLHGYCDADYAGDFDTRRSTTGYTFSLGSGSISWMSKRQPTVALSTTEAEYMAATEAAKEAIWLRSLLSELGYPQADPTILYDDNQSAIALANDPVHHARVKHIDVRHHFVREKIEEGLITLVYCQTDNMHADILTKPLSRNIFAQHAVALGIHE